MRTHGEPSLRRNRHAPLRLLPPGTKISPPLPLIPDATTKRSRASGAAPAASRPAEGAASEAAPLRPSPPQQPFNLHHLPAPHLRFRGQGAIDLLHPRQTLLDRRQHLLFQPGDLLFSIGPIDPAAPQRPAGMGSRNGSSSDLQNGEAADDSVAMVIGAESCAAMGPIHAGASPLAMPAG